MLPFNNTQYSNTSPSEMRNLIRNEQWIYPTSGLCKSYVQGNMIILPKEWAFDFLLFAQRNPKACPMLDVTEVGGHEPVNIAPGADVRTDLPKYRVWENGELIDEPMNVVDYWRDDLVTFIIGCSFSFETALIESSIPIRHMECNSNAPMYITNIDCAPAGRFSGPMVVSMRPIKHDKVPRAVLCTGRFPSLHGAPVHIGDPAAIGIKNIQEVDFGDTVEIRNGEVPVFWACGVTPQAVLMKSKPPFAITHSPGHMFICDKKDADYSIL